MEKDPLAVKIEPEDDLENNLQHEGTLEIESQFDIPIKSERRLKEVYECQQPEYGQRPTVFSPNKEELEKVLKVELYNNCRTPVYEQNIILLPHFKEEPDMDPDNSNCYDQDSCIRHGGSNYSRCEEEEWSKIAQRQDKYIKYGGTYSKRICKEEGCFKCARRGGKCIKHGGIQTKRVCKEEGCSKNALKGGKCCKHGGSHYNRCKEPECSKQAQGGGKCIKHGGIHANRGCKEEGCSKNALKGGKCSKHGGTHYNKCKEKGCTKYCERGGKCIKHGGIQYHVICKEEGCSKTAQKGGKCWKHGGPHTKRTRKRKEDSSQNIIRGEVDVLNMEEPSV